jgi:hypothetical protein
VAEQNERLAIKTFSLTKIFNGLTDKAKAQRVEYWAVDVAVSVTLNGIPGKSIETSCVVFAYELIYLS